MLRREGPGASSIEYGAEDHHLPRVNQRLPVSGVTGHDLPFGHVEREVWARRLEADELGAAMF
jgi:hypothetical protein